MYIPRHAIVAYNGPVRELYRYVMDGNNSYLSCVMTGKRYGNYTEQEITDYIKRGVWTVIQDLDGNDLPDVDDLI